MFLLNAFVVISEIYPSVHGITKTH
jgi:hypothetical protein